MGAKISGVGTSVLKIKGVTSLDGNTHTVIADRIEAGSFACIAGIMKTEITLKNIEPDILQHPISVLKDIGVKTTINQNSISFKESFTYIFSY